MTIRTRKTNKELEEFKTEVLQLYTKHLTETDDSLIRYHFDPRPTDDGKQIRYVMYKLVADPKLTFNDVFIPEKETLMRLLEDLKNDKITKLTLMFHGEPGCGKTTLIRLIGEHTGRHFKVIKPSLYSSNAQLKDSFFDPNIVISDSNPWMNTKTIEQDKMIFVLEEVDTELNVIEEKKKSMIPSQSNSQSLNTNGIPGGITNAPPCAKQTNVVIAPPQPISVGPRSQLDTLLAAWVAESAPPKVTLGTLLTTLDGIVPLNKAIVILTTNHIDKIDPALVRPGRIDLQIELTFMTAKHARALIIRLMTKKVLDVDWDALVNTWHFDDYQMSVAHVTTACRLACDPPSLLKQLKSHTPIFILQPVPEIH
jgi:SpoVK/Ycf46/Vps4 family AAA+-type ATPase